MKAVNPHLLFIAGYREVEVVLMVDHGVYVSTTVYCCDYFVEHDFTIDPLTRMEVIW
jgi:hypothetical protein